MTLAASTITLAIVAVVTTVVLLIADHQFRARRRKS